MGLFDNFKKKKKEKENTYSNQPPEQEKTIEQIMQEMRNEQIKSEQDLQKAIEQDEDMLYRMKQIRSSSSAADNLVRKELNFLEEEIKKEQDKMTKELSTEKEKDNKQTIAEPISSTVNSITKNEKAKLKSPSNIKEIIILYKQDFKKMIPESVAFIDDNGVIIAGPKDYEGKKIDEMGEIASLDAKEFPVRFKKDYYYRVTGEKILKEFDQNPEPYKKFCEKSKKTLKESEYKYSLKEIEGMTYSKLYYLIIRVILERINKDKGNIKTNLISSYVEQLMKFKTVPVLYESIEPELRKRIQLMESDKLTQQQTTSTKINAEFKHTNNGYSRDDEWDLANAIISTDVRPPEDYEENYHHHRR